MDLSKTDQRLIAAIQDGLPLVSRPFAEVGRQTGLSESEVIERIQALLSDGVVKRLGVVVRHHELGYRANAMVVWDVPDAEVASVGRRIGAVDFVTLCYRRPRRLPDWPYNLFCMIHGQDRDAVLGNIELLIRRCGLEATPHEVLFSRRRFKQRGARYVDPQQDRRAADGTPAYLMSPP
jgi:DNA-binding Lrp family transcriptional regulator